ncbi:PREDICTED: uncharacterized protein LOC108362923 [Rhagoletis zephyria]|uniref:uncharacterized protein LOC108362923 n=1 Tax=Rhagoletis zephyria TaxID=28612 RepID=UPI0008115ED7|nr:PREDICTED: uncharacterized protein LOC108362923 [Rhagoletis zephyria]
MSCCFRGCFNTRNSCRNTAVKHFKFPVVPYLREKWMKACGLSEQQLPREPFVCSNHFLSTDLIARNGRALLSRGAIPGAEIDQQPSGMDDDNEYCIDDASESPFVGISRKRARKGYVSVSTQTE